MPSDLFIKQKIKETKFKSKVIKIKPSDPVEKSRFYTNNMAIGKALFSHTPTRLSSRIRSRFMR